MLGNILIAEDETSLAKAMATKLRSSDFEVDIVATGEAAKKKLKAKHYDALLLDLVMPKGDGFSVMEYAKEHNIPTPIIVMSNLSEPEQKARGEKLGAYRFIVKADTSLKEVDQLLKNLVKVKS